MSAHDGAASWLEALEARRPLALDPSSDAGWFGGRSIVAFDPIDSGEFADNTEDSLAAAGDVLEAAFYSESPAVAVALLPYSGDILWARYECGFERIGDAWRAWGREPDAGWPERPTQRVAPGADPARQSLAVGPLATPLATSLSEREFCSAVEAVHEAILDGDVYVLNLTRMVRAQTMLRPAELFAALRDRAPATMAAAWLPADAPAVVSASPERFLAMRGHEIEIAPVKGTRPRGTSPAEDAAFAAELAASHKECAEHVMVVDLERNDLGRVCVPGSVRVDPLGAIETTSYCHQMVSSVRGLLRPDASIGEALRATFPCGSVTGAPKLSAMRIAGRLEPQARGVYTGSLVVAIPGQIDSSVLIRTAELHGDEIRYGTGCGITIDSDPAEEWRESELKTHPLLGAF